ncbi:hypothetical protein V1577_06940 [Enterobacter bugandensis]|uniref:hypothetical protein n=1 Tax=Enterobacter bugandensis TaxID=881260 RepID=UPI001EDB6084|nr:hypothetical protein [Enterobacter bugandensis]
MNSTSSLPEDGAAGLSAAKDADWNAVHMAIQRNERRNNIAITNPLAANNKDQINIDI